MLVLLEIWERGECDDLLADRAGMERMSSPARVCPRQCLYPLDLPKDVLFQPYDRQQQVIASTSYLAQASSVPSTPGPTNAVASSSRIPASPTCPVIEHGSAFIFDAKRPVRIPWALENGDRLYKTPAGLLEVAYPDPEERHLVRTTSSLGYAGQLSDAG